MRLPLDIEQSSLTSVQSSSTHRQLSTLIENIILQHVDRDTVAFVEELPKKFNARDLLLDQAGIESRSDSLSVSAPKPSARAVALVDRSADIASAARSIVQTRFVLGSQSRYAPDVTLVNEFAVREFIDAAIVALSENIEGTYHQGTPASLCGKDGLTDKEQRAAGVQVVFRGDLGTIAIVEDR